MKKVVLVSLLFVVCSISLWAQLARIEDKDGYVNIRSKPDASSPVLEKAIVSDVFYCFEREKEWYPVYLERTGNTIDGYIHKSRVKFIDTFDSLSVREIKTNKIVFQKDSIRVEMITKPFLKSAHAIQYDKTHRVVTTIDHKPIWGTDGNLPTVAYHQIRIKIGNKQVEVPDKELANLFEPNFDFTKVNYDKQSDLLYMSSVNSDGAGGYVVVWVIKEGKYSHRITLRPF